jgi:hypothetical protein
MKSLHLAATYFASTLSNTKEKNTVETAYMRLAFAEAANPLRLLQAGYASKSSLYSCYQNASRKFA